MKHIRHLALCLLLALSLMTSAFAAEVPEELVVENLNGQQRLVKTYVLSPEVDPDTLKEPPFDYDGFTYTWAYTTKEEQPYRGRFPWYLAGAVHCARRPAGGPCHHGHQGRHPDQLGLR